MARRITVANTAVPPEQDIPDSTPTLHTATPVVDYFIQRNGMAYAGTHLLLDFWGCENLDRLDIIETALREGARTAGATLLDVRLHHFTSSGGISGVAVLAESHISIHTWPERGYAALDIFMCGACDPYKAIPVLRRAMNPRTVQLHEQRRGLTI
ncbi:MAG: adenosylmethionine decarboxylase [Pseudomonadota bacterium]